MSDPRFLGYLEAKRRIDDRSLNRQVWDAMVGFVKKPRARPIRILEVGAGIGTMAERFARAGLLVNARYTAIDRQAFVVEEARRRLGPLGAVVELEVSDLFDLPQPAGLQRWDLIVAHAVLDLLPLGAALDVLLALLADGGGLYLTLNFDGTTHFGPPIDPTLDLEIEERYHRSMDDRRLRGLPTGGSRCGRRLFHELRAAGAQILVAGSSDWVVFAGAAGFEEDERAFLHYLLDTVEGELRGELGERGLRGWMEARRRQVEDGTLVFVAHQLDFFATR